MIRDSKLSGVLHVLLHMAEADGPVTSDTMAKVMHTNPVVIRRILAGLRKQGFVTSEKGHGGGWQLSCDVSTTTLHDIYIALDSPRLLAIGNRTEAPDCLVEQAVNAVMNQAFRDAEALLLARFGEVTLAALSEQLQRRRQDRTASPKHDQARRRCGIHGTDATDQGPLSPSSEEQPTAIADGVMAGMAARRSLILGQDQQRMLPAQTAHGHHTGHHHVFSGIERWLKVLENPERDTSQRPDEVIAHLGLQPNDVVADIGAGTGYFAIRIAEAYPQVRVVAADAEQEMIDYLASQSKKRNLANLEPVTIDPARPELPVQATLALLVNTLHHIGDRVAYLSHLNKSMAPDARIAVIDYTIEALEGPPADHRISAEAVREELKQAGYVLEWDLEFLPNQYFLMFKQG